MSRLYWQALALFNTKMCARDANHIKMLIELITVFAKKSPEMNIMQRRYSVR